jgi:hypothetical protein
VSPVPHIVLPERTSRIGNRLPCDARRAVLPVEAARELGMIRIDPGVDERDADERAPARDLVPERLSGVAAESGRPPAFFASAACAQMRASAASVAATSRRTTDTVSRKVTSSSPLTTLSTSRLSTPRNALYGS